MERLMGLENEYAFRATAASAATVETHRALEMLASIARKELVCLPSLNGAGVYLANGGRLYLDCGAHQEYCSPEVANPWDIVRYLLAGEQMLVELAGELTRRSRLRSATFSRTNVDYSGSQSTWGAHENYMHRANPSSLPKPMVPFLVSRVIYTGAGGFIPTTSTGCRFTLSPRAYHMTAAVSGNSTGERGIYHTKNEPLCAGGYNRLHVLVGESLWSQTANWLKFGTTALVVALAEAGIHPGEKVALRSPVQALREYASDPTCRATATLASGAQASALELQRHYLELTREHVAEHFMPPWAKTVVHEWDLMLRRLQDAPDSVATCLDWAIKYRIYSSRIDRRGFSWGMMGDLGNLLSLLRACNDVAGNGPAQPEATAKHLLDPEGPLRPVLDELCPYLHQRGLSLDQLEQFLRLRLELLEVDTRFGELGDDGIFNTMDRAGVLQHRFPGVDNIAHARENPPAIGRAKLRGNAIQRLHSQRQRFRSDWEMILDIEQGLALDLRDPWASTENWSTGVMPQAEFQQLLTVLRRTPAQVEAPF